MNKLNILIVEDDPMIAESVVELVGCLGHHPVGTADTIKKTFDLIEQEEVDMILLDIQLSEGDDGVTLARKLNAEYDIPFIFTTAFADDETLNRAKNECPYGYLVKPYGIKDLNSALEVALMNHARIKALMADVTSAEFRDDAIYLKVDSRLVKVAVPDILWVEAKGDYAVFKTAQKSYVVHATMKKIEDKLSSGRFMKVHRSYIINLDKVVDIEESNLMINEKIIPISRSNKLQLMSRINML